LRGGEGLERTRRRCKDGRKLRRTEEQTREHMKDEDRVVAMRACVLACTRARRFCVRKRRCACVGVRACMQTCARMCVRERARMCVRACTPVGVRACVIACICSLWHRSLGACVAVSMGVKAVAGICAHPREEVQTTLARSPLDYRARQYSFTTCARERCWVACAREEIDTSSRIKSDDRVERKEPQHQESKSDHACSGEKLHKTHCARSRTTLPRERLALYVCV